MKALPIPVPASIGRWAVGAVILAILVAAALGGWRVYLRNAAPPNIDVFVTTGDPLCETHSDSPLFVGVINNSPRAISGMKFVLEARTSDGKNLQSDFAYTDNTRIDPGNAMGDCWPANYESVETEEKVRARDLAWRVQRYELIFADSK